MSITIERKNEYWEASDGAWSLDGQNWYKKNKDSVHKDGAEYVLALREHLDTTAEPQRAKVGDWVEVSTRHINGSYCEAGVPYKVMTADEGDGQIRVDIPVAGWLGHTDYTIVPDPTPEPEVFTGDPSAWGEGWYLEVGGKEVVFVDCSGEWAAVLVVGYMGGVRGSISNGTLFKNKQKFHRISDNPADGVKWEGGEG